MKNNSNKLTLGIVIAVILFGGYFYMTQRGSGGILPESSSENAKLIDIETKTEVGFMEEDIKTNESTLVAQLDDVSGGDSTGMGYVLREDDKLTHVVEATLPVPVGEQFYEGWLVQQQPELQFFSTGELVQGEDGTYMLNYESDELNEGYNFVVITLEETRDDVPEAHVIEGLAVSRAQ